MDFNLKIIKVRFLLGLCLGLIVIFLGCIKTARVEVLGDERVSFNVEIADSFVKKRLGLMFRKGLEKDQGMLFVYQKPEGKSFWMKNTKIALDIIFISKDKKIVNIEQADPCSQKPCRRYHSRGKVMYTLEINQGLSRQYGFKAGTAVNFKF